MTGAGHGGRQQGVAVQYPLAGGSDKTEPGPYHEITEHKNTGGDKGCSRSRRFRLTAAKVRIMGAALGSIMATIISDHMRKRGTKVEADHGPRSGPDIFMPTQQQMP